jgi:CelD/BcsL family acetyltransferase involved in cellulose biosynthesis
MRVTVVRPDDLGTAEAGLWLGFQQSMPVGLNPFFSLTYIQAVGRSRDNARVALVEDGGQIVAFFPFEVRAHSIGIPIGFPMNNLQGIIGIDLPLDARWVVRQAGLRGWRFGSVAVEQRALAPFHYAGSVAPCPAIDLTTGDLSHISARNKARRALEREFGPVTLEWHTADPGEVERMIAWKSRRYVGASRLFGDPTARSIVAELAETKSGDCAGVVSVLRAGERSIAVHLGLRGPRALAGWFMSYDPELSRFAPGMMLWRPLAQAAAEHDVCQIDLGPGQDAYKFELANNSYMVAGGAVWTTNAEAVGRKVFRNLRSALHRRTALTRTEIHDEHS